MAYNTCPPPPYASSFQPPQPAAAAHAPPAAHLRGHAHAQHPPAQHGFHSIPGLHPPPAAFPALHFTSYGQNNQQPPFAPPQLPPDPHMSMFPPHGMFPPPPIPGLAMPPASLPHTPQNRAVPTGLPPHPAPPQAHARPAKPTAARVQGLMDSDREDDECSDGPGAPRGPPPRPNGKVPVEAPRYVPRLPSAAMRVEEAYNPDRPAAGQTLTKPTAPSHRQPASPPSLKDRIQTDREEAKQFVKTLNSSGIGYRTLAQERLDTDLLRGLYQSLNLPSEPALIDPPKSNANASEKPAVGLHTNQSKQPVDSSKTNQSAPMLKINVATSTSSKPAASPVTRRDRTDYVARLQAARMAKQAAEAKASPPQQAAQAKSSTNSAPPAPAVQAPRVVAIPTPAAEPSMTDEQRRARTTELVKQRLKELKGLPKPAQFVKNNTVAEPVAREIEQAPRTPNQGTSSASAASSTRGDHAQMPTFPGIPGLFMNTQPHDSRHASTPAQALSSVPQKRPVPSDSTGVSTPRGSITSFTRPLGQSPHAHYDEDESMIIQVSDDESNGSHMDLDDDEPVQKPFSGTSAPLQSTPQGIGILPNFPSRSASVKPASSAVSTPGPQTPSTQAREKQLEDKEQQLAAMRLTLKKKLAEKREKDRAAAAAAAVMTSSPLQQQSSTSGSRPENEAIPKMPTTNMDSGTSFANATGATSDTGRDHKRQRRVEIQSRLPTLDAEIANNASRMARLTEEMNKLLAENEKITKDKEQLTKELEDLGIDTEGMSHAQLRAKKDEIEREKSPEKETVNQNAPAASNPSSSELAPAATQAHVTKAAGLPTGVLLPASNSLSPQFAGLPGLGPSMPLAPSAAPQRPAKSPSPSVDGEAVISHVPHTLSPPEKGGPDKMETAKPEAASLAKRGSATPVDDEEDFYSPPPPGEVDLHLETDADAAPQVPVEPIVSVPESPSEEGEVEMSESSDEDEVEEEEYEPKEPAADAEMAISDTQAPGTDLGRSLAPSQVSAEDDEDYEPPDVDGEMPDIGNDITTAGPDDVLTPAEANEGEMDMATCSSGESDDSDPDSDDETTSEPDSVSGNNGLPQPTDTTDNVAPVWQVTDAAATNAPDSVPVEDEHEQIKFTPYESPLRMFKSYRYHPKYASDVAGGFLSWTFSHQIDAQKRLCQYECAGGSCNDSTCINQHFRDIGITGEKLLVQLGTANPGENAEERQKWNDGLRSVLKELRIKNIKDPNGIAVEIAKYRRQFLNDETRVVNLPAAGQ